MDDQQLQEIEARAQETVRRCTHCDAPARWWMAGARSASVWLCDDHNTRPPHATRIEAVELDALDLVAEVRRLRAEHTAALKAAREEGAAAMRERAVARFKARVEYLRPWAEAEADESGYHAGAWAEALNAGQFARELAFPLDAPGGGS